VRHRTLGGIARINFVAAAVVLGQKAAGSLVGPGFLENAPGACQNDLSTNIAAIRRFLHACIVKPVSQDDFEVMLAFNMVVKPNVRAALVQRELDFGPLIDGITVPVLITHVRADTMGAASHG
jgi:non-heme chloroperoxidase